MYQQKIAKHLIELNKTDFDDTFNTMTRLQRKTDAQFFRFVDKNPLLADNSQEAIYEYLVSSRKRAFEYKRQIDENYETTEVGLFMDDTCKK